MALFFESMVKRSVTKKTLAKDPSTLHVIIPHCTNWKLTEVTLESYLRLTRRPVSITVVNNFDVDPPTDHIALKSPQVTLVKHQWSWVWKIVQKIYSGRSGSGENALALDAGISAEPQFEWAFMSHSDSGPLQKNWDDVFFGQIGDQNILGNTRDPIRIRAAHASGTLFNQRSWLASGLSTKPVYQGKNMILDVGDQITAHFWQNKSGQDLVPVLPNTKDNPDWTSLLSESERVLHDFAVNGSIITFDPKTKTPVFGHMGRGTPRNSHDPMYAHKPPVEHWMELVKTRA